MFLFREKYKSCYEKIPVTMNEIAVELEVTELMEKTLRELCNELNISRRTVQGYENKGLVYPSRRTERGYLLYDEEAQKKIQTIRFYQELGFSRKKIAFLLNAPKEILKEEMQNAIKLSVPMTVNIAKGKRWYDAKD